MQNWYWATGRMVLTIAVGLLMFSACGSDAADNGIKGKC